MKSKPFLSSCLFPVFLHFLFGGVCLLQCSKVSYEIVIPDSEVQQSLDKKFPISKSYAEIAKITLSDPSLNLGNRTDRLTMGLNAIITPRIFEFEITNGRVVFTGGLSFNDSTGEFLLKNVTVDTIIIDLSNLNKKIQDEIKNVIVVMLQENLEGIPMYRLNPRNFRTSIAKLFIRKVTIRKKKIIVTLGI